MARFNCFPSKVYLATLEAATFLRQDEYNSHIIAIERRFDILSNIAGLYLKPSLKIASLLGPTPIQSLDLTHILAVRLVVASDLGSWMRIIQSFALLPLEPAINRVPSRSFLPEVGSKGCKEFPAV